MRVRDDHDGRPHVVIIGGGFGGLICARELAGELVRVTLVDRSNHHLFQPLLYQVATAGLSPAEIAVPIRSVVRDAENVTVLLAEVTGIDLASRRVVLRDEDPLDFDYLVLAAGARTSYFGHDEWAHVALGLKDIDDALEIRRRVLLAYELAEHEDDPERRRKLLTFVVIGGGPTGVEMAGAVAELSRFVLARDFRRIEPRATRVLLVEAGDRVLSAYSPELSTKGLKQLEELGVEVRTGAKVTHIDAGGVHLGTELVPAETVVWAAGVRASPLAETLGVKLDRGGRVMVAEDCSIPGHPNAFAIGDIACFPGPGGKPLPGVSPVAMQQARSVAANIVHSVTHQPREPFTFLDKGSMATIGRSRAIAEMRGIELSGFLAWLAWLFVHIWYLIGFRNRLVVMLSWCWSYVTYKRGARLITGRLFTDGAATPADPPKRP